MRFFITKFLLIILIFCYGQNAFAVTALRADINQKKQTTNFYLRLNKKPTNVKNFILPDPNRFVIDIDDLDWKIRNKIVTKGIINKVRFGKGSKLGRIVLDLDHKVTEHALEITKHPRIKDCYLLTLRLENIPKSKKVINSSPKHKKNIVKKVKKKKFYSKHQFKKIKRRNPNEIIITVDAGHGGNDPGATSVSGYKEKNIVLAFAKEFANAINRQNNMRAILTRHKDFFIPLTERHLIAKHYQSDLLISIHADAFKDKTFSGATVYTLSDKASDKIAAQIAKSENQSDIIAGVDFDNQLPEVTDIIIDFMRRETDIASYEFAENLVRKLKKSTDLVASPHRKAGFIVLKSPNIPSVLVELGYLTSKEDERRLTNPQKRRKMIASMINAIKTWHYQRRLSGH